MRSLTFIATQSIPTVVKRRARSATITLVPTPSVHSAIPRFGATSITLA